MVHPHPGASFLGQGLTAQRTNAVSALVKAARRAILCTGTPALSRPLELYAQASRFGC